MCKRIITTLLLLISCVSLSADEMLYCKSFSVEHLYIDGPNGKIDMPGYIMFQIEYGYYGDYYAYVSFHKSDGEYLYCTGFLGGNYGLPSPKVVWTINTKGWFNSLVSDEAIYIQTKNDKNEVYTYSFVPFTHNEGKGVTFNFREGNKSGYTYFPYDYRWIEFHNLLLAKLPYIGNYIYN